MGVVIIVISFTIGGIIGSVSGYYGGFVYNILMRIMDIFYAIPYNLFAICIVAALGSGMINLVAAMSIALIPMFSRVVRSAVLPVCSQEYIESARACGTSDLRIIVKHVLPNAIGPIIVQATMAVGSAIISAAGISFVGMGIQPPAPEWGALLSDAQAYMFTAPYMLIFPGLFIILAALSFNLVGDGLTDALDPKLRD